MEMARHNNNSGWHISRNELGPEGRRGSLYGPHTCLGWTLRSTALVRLQNSGMTDPILI